MQKYLKYIILILLIIFVVWYGIYTYKNYQSHRDCKSFIDENKSLTENFNNLPLRCYGENN